MTSKTKHILIVYKNIESAEYIAKQLRTRFTEVLVATNLQEAMKSFRMHAFDMMIFDSRFDLSFMAEARKHMPYMHRILVETKPLQINMHALINELAPSAIFTKIIDRQKILELLDINRNLREEDLEAPLDIHNADPDTILKELLFPSKVQPPMSEMDKIQFLTDLSVKMNSMVEDPNLVLPVLPEMALKVRELMADEKCDFESVADLVEVEQGMSSRILQISNSPIYAGLERIRNMQQAVARLGLRQTRNILQVVIAQNLFRSTNKSMQKLMEELWLHSLCVAYGNDLIAQRMQIQESRDYFMMGLLHDIGKLIILHLLETGRQKGYWENREVTEEVMFRLMAMRHLDLGARLLQKWHYPINFQEVVRLHNDPENIQLRSEPVVVTYFSNLLARKIGYSLVPYEGDPLANKNLANALNISDQVRMELEESLRVVTSKIRESCLMNA